MDMTIMSCEGFDSRIAMQHSHFRFVVEIPGMDIWTNELIHWLKTEVGDNHTKWEWWWRECYHFEFKYEEDKVKFILRWL